jgi:hypothetical protein
MKKPKAKTIFLPLSVLLNVFFIFLFALALTSKTGASISFFNMDDMDENSITAAQLVSVMPGNDVVFNAVDITIRRTQKAAVQFSNRVGGIQSNYVINALYDRSIIAVEKTGYGILITALAEGESTLQTIGSEGITDIVHVRVVSDK